MEKTREHCTYCGMYFLDDHAKTNHEATCIYNPRNKSCDTCSFCSRGKKQFICWANPLLIEEKPLIIDCCDYKEKI